MSEILVPREIKTAVLVQVIKKIGPDYRLIQYENGDLEIIYGNGNPVGLEMQGRIMGQLVRVIADSPPPCCSRCNKFATKELSQVDYCIWCLEERVVAVFNDQPEDTSEGLESALERAKVELQRLKELGPPSDEAALNMRLMRIAELEKAIQDRSSVRQLETAVHGWDTENPPITAKNSFA